MMPSRKIRCSIANIRLKHQGQPLRGPALVISHVALRRRAYFSRLMPLRRVDAAEIRRWLHAKRSRLASRRVIFRAIGLFLLAETIPMDAGASLARGLIRGR